MAPEVMLELDKPGREGSAGMLGGAGNVIKVKEADDIWYTLTECDLVFAGMT